MTTTATSQTAKSTDSQPSGQAADTSRGRPVVAVQQLTKIFKDFWMRDRARAVSNLTFEIYPQEIFGLLGPNGSGKSTTIKMLLGLLRPTSGRVSVFDKPASDVNIKKRIGYLPEESYLYGFLNARETLDYYGKLFEIEYKTRQRRIDQLLDMIGLTGAQYRPVREYSKGMQRRIGIAQALINDPDFLILDEPTTGLDPIGTRQIKDLIIELGRRGKTILLSSHLLADVEDCVDRLIILYGGQKRAEGTCDSLLTTETMTTIETDALDDETVAEIDKLIRARSGGAKSIARVAKPRQSLEELFLDIVERAKSEQLATSGATAGGQTAEFLRSQEAVQGEALIDKLMTGAGSTAAAAAAAEAAAPPPAATPAPEPASDEPDEEVIEGLLSTYDDEPAGAPPQADTARTSGGTQGGNAPVRPTPPPKPPPADIDRSVIGSLIDDDDKANEGDKPDSENRR